MDTSVAVQNLRAICLVALLRDAPYHALGTVASTESNTRGERPTQVISAVQVCRKSLPESDPASD